LSDPKYGGAEVGVAKPDRVTINPGSSPAFVSSLFNALAVSSGEASNGVPDFEGLGRELGFDLAMQIPYRIDAMHQNHGRW
jgi:hypothetical protein